MTQGLWGSEVTTKKDLLKFYGQKFTGSSVIQMNKTTKDSRSRPRKTIRHWLQFI